MRHEGAGSVVSQKEETPTHICNERGPCALVRKGEQSARKEKKKKRRDEPEKGSGVECGVHPRARCE